MYYIAHAIDVIALQTIVNEKLEDGFIPIGGISIRNIGKSFRCHSDNINTEIEYYQPMIKLSKDTNLYIFNKSCVLHFN